MTYGAQMGMGLKTEIGGFWGLKLGCLGAKTRADAQRLVPDVTST